MTTSNSGPTLKFRQAIAILAGDALLSKSFEHIAKYTQKDIPAERIVEVLVRFGEVGWRIEIDVCLSVTKEGATQTCH